MELFNLQRHISLVYQIKKKRYKQVHWCVVLTLVNTCEGVDSTQLGEVLFIYEDRAEILWKCR
jgi:hypothetical protein